jgi:flagellar protein FlaI
MSNSLNEVFEKIKFRIGSQSAPEAIDQRFKDREFIKTLRQKAIELDKQFSISHEPIDKVVMQEQMGYMRKVLEKDKTKIDLVYPINPPYGFVNIKFNRDDGELTYNVREPQLRDDEDNQLKLIKNKMEATMDQEEIPISDETVFSDSSELSTYLRKLFDEVVNIYDVRLTRKRQEVIFYHIQKELLGWGRPDVIFRDQFIEDISCNGPRVPMFIYHRVFGSMKTNVVFETDNEINRYVIKLAQIAGKHVSVYQPILDATLSDGSRINLTLGSEVTRKGSTFTIRKFSHDPISPVDLLKWGSVSADQMAFFWLMIEKHKSLLISGGTASGKTTLMNAISMFIKPEDKVVSIEDTPEIHIDHVNWIQSISRKGFGSGGGGGGGTIGMYDLLAAALRQRPEYVIVGEVRGKEAFTLFQAISVGHAAMATIHAGSIDELIHRVENEPMNIPRSLFQSLDLAIFQGQVMIDKRRVRRVKWIVEILDVEKGSQNLITNNVYSWDPKYDRFNFGGRSYVLEQVAEQSGKSIETIFEEITRRERYLKLLDNKNVTYFKDVSKAIGNYYLDPVSAFEQLEKRVD